MIGDNAKDRVFHIAKWSNAKTFKRALKFCKKKGGMLFEPRDERITKILYSQMESENIESFWLGVHDKINEGYFVYASDNSVVTWQDWAVGQPTFLERNQHCVAARNTWSNQLEQGYV